MGASSVRTILQEKALTHVFTQDGDNVNNYIEVVGDVSDPRIVEARKRLLSEGGCLTDAERQQLRQQLGFTTD